jgi:hypothetical protein
MALEEEQIETILKLFEHQGMLTIQQAMSLYPEKISDSSLRRSVNKMIVPTEDHPKALLGLSSISIPRPWKKPTGAPESIYYLTEAGAYEYTKLTGIRLVAPNPQAQPKSKQHALALVDIAIAIRDKNGRCICNRQVNIDKEDEYEEEINNSTHPDDKKNSYTRPDIQFSYIGSPDFVQFIEYEQSRKQIHLEDILVARMNRWQDLLSSEDGTHYSKDILVLYFLDPVDKEKRDSLSTWMKALYRFIELRNGELPTFKIYYKYFEEFIQKPSLSIKDYVLMEASQDPRTYFMRKDNEEFFKQKAKEIFEPLNSDLSNKTNAEYYKEKYQLLAEMQNYTGRQEYFFTQAKKLYELSILTDKPNGYSLASVPWVSIGLLRQWVEQPQLRTLRERLVIGLAEVHAGYLRGMSIAADILDRVMWESIFSYFNFAQGGPLGYFTNLNNSIDGKEKNNRLIPVTSVSSHWEGVCTNDKEARLIENAINWMIATIIQYPGELGLTKNIKPYMSILHESISSSTQKKPVHQPKTNLKA